LIIVSISRAHHNHKQLTLLILNFTFRIITWYAL